MITDYYKLLSVSNSATVIEIKKAYRKLALKVHPDVSKEVNSGQKFIEIQEAYEILCDKNKREKYNILYENSFKVKEKFERVYRTSAETEFDLWQREAKLKAERRSKESFTTFKRNVKKDTKEEISIGEYFGFFIFVIMLLVAICSSYASIDEWNIDKNGNAIAGFVICCIIALILILPRIILPILEKRQKKNADF